jgi:hypothetical protein
MAPVQYQQLTRGRPGPPLARLHHNNNKRETRTLIGANY